MKGFLHEEKLIQYLDPRGKDAGLERWRADLYYAPGWARVHFCRSEEEYEKFIRDHRPMVYKSYEEFVRNYKGGGTMNKRCEVFLNWCRSAFDESSWYSITEDVLESIRNNWGQWEDALISWGYITGNGDEKEMRERLEMLSPSVVIHLSDVIQQGRLDDF